MLSAVERRLIGRRIAEARQGASLTQVALASELGVTPRSLQNWEAGSVVPYRHLNRIENLTHRRRGWLLKGGEGDSDLFSSLRNALARHRALVETHRVLLATQVELLSGQREARWP